MCPERSVTHLSGHSNPRAASANPLDRGMYRPRDFTLHAIAQIFRHD